MKEKNENLSQQLQQFRYGANFISFIYSIRLVKFIYDNVNDKPRAHRIFNSWKNKKQKKITTDWNICKRILLRLVAIREKSQNYYCTIHFVCSVRDVFIL